MEGFKRDAADKGNVDSDDSSLGLLATSLR
jgi:hypothetical protein